MKTVATFIDVLGTLEDCGGKWAVNANIRDVCRPFEIGTGKHSPTEFVFVEISSELCIVEDCIPCIAVLNADARRVEHC